MSMSALAPGNVAVITGGASGIGLAVARKLLARGMRVVIADRDAEALGALPTDDDRLLAVNSDVSDWASVQQLAATVASKFGPVSCIMNNAAIGGGGDALADLEGWMRLLGVNLNGVLHGVQAFVPEMIASDRPGIVINTGSKQGITQPPGNTAYNVAKSGVKSLTEGLAHTLRERTGGRVTAHLLVPGYTYTGMTAKRIAQKPAAAWTPEQVADFLLESLEKGDFYILCPDNETTRAQDNKRMNWAMGDLIANRPALSRWHPDFKAAFEDYMREE